MGEKRNPRAQLSWRTYPITPRHAVFRCVARIGAKWRCGRCHINAPQYDMPGGKRHGIYSARHQKQFPCCLT